MSTTPFDRFQFANRSFCSLLIFQWESLTYSNEIFSFTCVRKGNLCHSARQDFAQEGESYGAGLKATATLDQLPVGRPEYMVCQVTVTGAVLGVM